MADQVKCAIYARFSSNNQREASIDDQVRKCMNTAAGKGWAVLPEHIYADRAISGKSISPRLEFKKLLSLATSGKCPFSKVLVDETSRVSRNTKEALDVFSLLTFYDVHVYYVSQGIDTSHESAEQMITVNGIIDSLYLKNIAKETHRGVEGQVLKGFSGGGKRYGYRSVPVYSGKVDIYGQPEADGYRLVINPEEAETVVRIFRLFAESGHSAKKIVSIFNKELKESSAPKPPRGRWWTVSTILGSRKFRRGILNNEIYIGWYNWNCSRTVINPTSGKRSVRINDKSVWQLVEKRDLAIVPQRLWEKAKERQKTIVVISQGRYTKGKSIYSVNLLTGFLRCPVCDGNLVIVSGGKYGKYGCSNNWNRGPSVCHNDLKQPKSVLEKKIINLVAPNLLHQSFMNYLLKQVTVILDNKAREERPGWQGGALSIELVKVEKEITNVLNAIKAGVIMPSVKKELQLLETRKTSLAEKLEYAQSVQKDVFNEVSCEDLAPYLRDMHCTLRLNPSIGREVLSRFAGHVNLNLICQHLLWARESIPSF